MSFLDRLRNTVMVAGTMLLRDWYLVPAGEALLREVFPGRPVPSLLELESRAALVMNAGNSHLGDGMRPRLPHTHLIGMMQCRQGAAGELPPELQVRAAIIFPLAISFTFPFPFPFPFPLAFPFTFPFP